MSGGAQEAVAGPGLMRLALSVLWPAFLAATLAEASFFSWFEPEQLSTLAPQAVYSIGFFFFWMFCTLASLLTAYLVRVPEGQGPPF